MTKEKANRNEVVGMFLTYCRKTLVNARTDVLRERKRRRNREVLFCDLRRSELESLADWQDVPERETVFDAAGKPIGVTDKDLADALEKLCPEEQADVYKRQRVQCERTHLILPMLQDQPAFAKESRSRYESKLPFLWIMDAKAVTIPFQAIHQLLDLHSAHPSSSSFFSSIPMVGSTSMSGKI